jgi:hypothetical protein
MGQVVREGGFYGPMFRCFCVPLRGSRLLVPQPEMAEEAFYDMGIIDEADDFHLMAAAGTTERVDFPDFLDELSPVTPTA